MSQDLQCVLWWLQALLCAAYSYNQLDTFQQLLAAGKARITVQPEPQSFASVVAILDAVQQLTSGEGASCKPFLHTMF